MKASPRELWQSEGYVCEPASGSLTFAGAWGVPYHSLVTLLMNRSMLAVKLASRLGDSPLL